MANGDEQSRPLPGSAASNLGGTAIQYGSDSDDTDDDGFLTADEHSAEPSPEDVCQQNTSSSDIHLPPIQTTTITAVISSIDIGGMQSSGGHSIKDESAIRTASSPSPAQPSNVNRTMIYRMQTWAVCFLLLNFDLEIGQAVEFIYPPLPQPDGDDSSVPRLTEQDISNIRFAAFPDSGSNSGDSLYSFTIPHSSVGTAGSQQQYYYGYVFFRQQKDSTNRRGYLQKSLVLLSHLPFPGLFLRLLAILGPVHFNGGTTASRSRPLSAADALDMTVRSRYPAIESACYQISRWPAPDAGALVDLKFWGVRWLVELPMVSGGDHDYIGQVNSRTGSNCDNGVIGGQMMLENSRLVTVFRHRRGQFDEPILAGLASTLIYPTGWSAFLPAISFLSSSSTKAASQLHSQHLMMPDSPISPLTAPTPFCDLALLSHRTPSQALAGSNLGMFLRLYDILDQLWLIWELVLLGEPLLVMGGSQVVISEAVWWLTSLISPLSFQGQYRPYFTIQDSEYPRYANMFRETLANGKTAIISGPGNNTASSDSRTSGDSSGRSSPFQLLRRRESTPDARESGSAAPTPPFQHSPLSSANIIAENRPNDEGCVPSSNSSLSSSVSSSNEEPPDSLLAGNGSETVVLANENHPQSSTSATLYGSSVDSEFKGGIGYSGLRRQRPKTAGSLGSSISPERLPRKLVNGGHVFTPNTNNSIIIGATNPFFLKAFDNWPHKLYLTAAATNNIPTGGIGAAEIKSKASGVAGGLINRIPTGIQTKYVHFVKSDKKLIESLKRIFQQYSTVDTKPSATAKSPLKRIISEGNADKGGKSSKSAEGIYQAMLNRIDPDSLITGNSASRYCGAVFNEVLRRQFVDLTERFLAPLNRYFITLLPPSSSSSFTHYYSTAPLTSIQFERQTIPFKVPVPFAAFQIQPFNSTQFMQHLAHNDLPQIEFRKSMRSKWTRFYQQFIERSPNFQRWLAEQRQRAIRKLRSRYTEQLATVDVSALSLEDLVTFLLAIRRELILLQRDFIRFSSSYRSLVPVVVDSGGLPLADPVLADRLEQRGRQIWDRLEPAVQTAFLEGLFDPLLSA